jgi:hypothetical protein
MKDEAGLGLAIHWIQQTLVSAFEDNCPLRPMRKGKKCLRWTIELEILRREVRRLFNICRANNDCCELYRENQRRYRKEVPRASREKWRSFVSSINELPRAARIHKALSRGSKIRMGSLVSLSGLRTQSEVETLDLLLATHFPGSISVEGERYPLPAAVPTGCTGKWQRGWIHIKVWSGRLTLLPHIRFREWMGFFRPWYNRNGRSLIPT